MAGSTEVVVEDPEPVRDVPGGWRRMRNRPVSDCKRRRKRDGAGYDYQHDADRTTDSRSLHHQVTRSTPFMIEAWGSQTNL